MGKKKKRRHDERESRSAVESLPQAPVLKARGKQVIFAVGDADFGYTEGKILRLARRLKEQMDWNILVMTHDPETFEAAKKPNLDARRVDIESPGVTVEERLQ